ncbi:hypothetical protein HNR43_000177 [Anoxybacillus mongoliensis]|uniref:Uncharacterized protein n=1 Tax=Anoxybacillus mongoliensis TaxID=452565 RepID=A0A7W8JBW4_9BACL|nr:DUF6345 domain-containing protein [Anoxybacillus mongoliensis]MBB5354222.1 hypothetical protein [Anoxybacillus mongoliensis]
MLKKMKKNLGKKSLLVAMAGALGLNLVPLSAEAALEYTVLGVGSYVSSSLSDLDNGDAYKFRDRLSEKNWTRTAQWYDSAVYYTDFTKYGNESDILYFTGHGGSSGNLALSYRYVETGLRDFANWYQVGGDIKGTDRASNEDAEWMIFAACEALDQVYWGKQLANGLHHIFGYHGVSNDYTDTKIIDNFFNRALGVNGYSAYTLFSAWMHANRTYSEYDWAIIGHNNNIYDYLHNVGSGATADVTGTSDVYRWKGTGPNSIIGYYTTENISSYLKTGDELTTPTTQEELDELNNEYRVKFKVKPEKINLKMIQSNLLGENYTEFNYKENKSKVYSSQSGTLEVYNDNSFVYSRQIEFDPITKSSDEVLKDINAFIEKNGGLRSDLKLKHFLPMVEQDDLENDVIVGYTVVFVQSLNGTYLDGEAAEAIVVGYDKNGVNFYKRNVKEVTQKIKVKNLSVKKLEKAMETAKEKANSHFKFDGNIDFTKAEIVYFSSPIGLGLEKDELRPAYKLSVNETNAIYIDALTGEHLNGAKMLTENETYIVPEEAFSPEYKEKYEKELENRIQESINEE